MSEITYTYSILAMGNCSEREADSFTSAVEAALVAAHPGATVVVQRDDRTDDMRLDVSRDLDADLIRDQIERVWNSFEWI